MHYHLTEKTSRLQHYLETGVVRQVLFTGHPGTGKTSFSEHYASHREAQYFYFLCHPWVTDEHLFSVLDVAAVAIGVEHKEQAFTPGILRMAAEASLQGPVVLCLDEIDKVSTKVETLLLDFLQTGRVPLPDHRQIQANQQNLVVFLTSNGQRQLSDALLRRLYRFEMQFLPGPVEADIIRHQTGAPMPVIKKVVQLATVLRQSEEASKPSLTEMVLLVRCLLCDGASVASIEQDVAATLIKSEEDVKVFRQIGNYAAMLYGLVQQAQQEQVKQRYLVSVG